MSAPNSASLNISPDHLAQLWNKKGLIYRKAGKLVESIECYDKALEIDASNAPAWSNKARALDEMNMLPEAMKCYKKALQLNPNSASTWNNQGYAYRKMKRYKEALECYDRAIQLWPQYDKAWFNRGYIFEQQERYREALECFNYAIEFNPENEKYKRSREIVYQTLKQQQQELQKPESPPPPGVPTSRPDKRDKPHQPLASSSSGTASSDPAKAQRAAATRSPAPDRPVARTAAAAPGRQLQYPYQSISPDPEEDFEVDNLAGSDAVDVGAPSGHISDGEVRHVSHRTSPTTASHHGTSGGGVISPHGTLRDSNALREILVMQDAGASSSRYHDAGAPSNHSSSFGNPFGFESADEAPEPGSMPPPLSMSRSQQAQQRVAVKPNRSYESFDSLQGSDELPVVPPKSAQTPTKQRAAALTSSEETRLQQQLAFLALQEQQQQQQQQHAAPAQQQAPLSMSRRGDTQRHPSGGSRSDPSIEIRSGQQTPNSSGGGDLGPRDIASPRLPEEPDAIDAFDQLLDQLNSIESIEGVYVFESRVEELLGAVRQRKQELQSRISSGDDVKCSICLDEPPQMICIPCGHLCLCENCSKKLTKKKCPICNLRVKNIYKVFKA